MNHKRQTISRQLRRGNAVVTFSSSQGMEVQPVPHARQKFLSRVGSLIVSDTILAEKGTPYVKN